MRELLTQQVAPRFFVDSEDSVYILGLDDPGRSLIRPNLYVAETAPLAGKARARGTIAMPMLLDLPEPLEVRIPHVVLRDAADRRVVATIEVLSPINKLSGSDGQRDFWRKHGLAMRSDAHWLEIDLLRAGSRPPGIPARGHFSAALHRAEAGSRVEVWFTTLREPLPTIAVPLRPPAADAALDLQEAIDLLYARHRYDIGIDYDEDPPPPLSENDLA